MSIPASDLPSDAMQKSAISTSLNSTLTLTFLMGIYTVVYFGTLYLYLVTRKSQRRTIVGTITVLYFLGIVQLCLQWYTFQWSFVANGDTRASIFVSFFAVPVSLQLVGNLCTLFMLVLSDGLLIWRCFTVWNRSRRIISLPLFLFVGEIALCLAVIIIYCRDFRGITNAAAHQINAIQSSLFCVSFAASLAATLLIAYRIHSVAKQDGTSRRRFRHIIEIVVQSAMVYSPALLLQAIYTALPLEFSINPARMFALSNYGGALTFPILGLAPTIMVARVCFAADDKTLRSSTHHLSGLQFEGQLTSHNDTGSRMDSTSEMNREIVLPRDGEKTESMA